MAEIRSFPLEWYSLMYDWLLMAYSFPLVIAGKWLVFAGRYWRMAIIPRNTISLAYDWYSLIIAVVWLVFAGYRCCMFYIRWLSQTLRPSSAVCRFAGASLTFERQLLEGEGVCVWCEVLGARATVGARLHLV